MPTPFPPPPYCYAGLGNPAILKIAHIDTGKDFRGGQELLVSLARGLKQRGHRQVIIPRSSSPLAGRASAEAFDVCPLGGMIALRRFLRDQQVDIVHAHDGRAQTISYRASLGLPVVRVATRQVAFTPRHPLVHRWKYSLTSNGVIANSQAVRRVLLDAGVPDAHIEVIEPGIELPPARPSAATRAEARARWNLSPDHFVLGHIGAFTREKGQDIAVQAAALLAPKLPHARILLAGDGPEKAALERAAPDNVQFPGFLDDPDSIYSALDLFIMPSRSESWGLTALRAMSFGIPVIASAVGGLAELVEPGISGWLVPPESPEALAAAILEAASDADRLRQLGCNARTRAEQFPIARTVERTEQFYLRLLSAAGAGRPQPI